MLPYAFRKNPCWNAPGNWNFFFSPPKEITTIAAWGEDYYGHENTLTVHIRRLREKLEDTPSAPKYLWF